MKRKPIERLVEDAARAEARMVRAFNAWNAARLRLARVAKRLDREFNEGKSKIGGQADLRDFPQLGPDDLPF